MSNRFLVSKIRKEFPFLKRKYRGFPLAYLDNASTTQKPQTVIEAISDVYKNHYANIHRGVYDLSVEATDLYEGVREKAAKFIGAKSEKEIIFTRNATEGINLLSYTLEPQLKDGDEILLSQMEHHSNIVPWQMLAKRAETRNTPFDSKLAQGEQHETRNIKIKYIPIDQEGRLDLSTLDKLITKKTKIVSLTLMSNVLGTINPIKQIVSRIKNLSSGPLIIVDAAQAAAHMKIDVSDLACDFLVISSHKMYGPSGVGVLWGKKDLLEVMPPFLGGGDMILSVDFEKTTFNELPWKFEAGTPNVADVIAFGEAIRFLERQSFEKLEKHEMELTKYAFDQLSSDQIIQLFGPSDLKDRGPVISFNINGIHPHDVASILSEEAVAIRSGHHCAQPLMGVLGVGAVCRASFGVYNTKEEIQRLIDGVEKVKEVFRLKTKAKRLTQKSFRSVSP